MMSATEKITVTKKRKKNGQYSRKGHHKKVDGLKKGRLMRVAKSKGEPLPVFNRAFENNRESDCDCDRGTCTDCTGTQVHLDHDYFGIQDEVTVFDDVHSPVDDDKTGWRVGRRIVDLGVLADGLRACQLCQLPLHLHNCVGEKKFGLSQILEIKCNNCDLINNVVTGSRHRTDKGGLAWDANTKLAAGMINGGLGETHVNTLLAILNIPGICHANLKEREREVGQKLEEMAIASCSRNLANEVALTDSQEDGIVASFDGAWQKRGTGRAYNSLTGHATLIGQKTGKCVGYALKSKKCRICSAAKVKNVTPRKHNCKKNWSGSAKAMEPAMACEMLQSILDSGEKVSTLVMDNDSTTIARVKSTVDKSITKRCDSNHTKKGFTASLIELSKTHKLLRNTKVRTHIERCFTYSVSQNRGEPEQLAKGLSSIVPHLYGDHSDCGTWCRGNEEGYKHQALPYGKPLDDQDLRVALQSLMNKFTLKATELANMGSTQPNESFNNMASSKAPKRL
ncbi:uncharacterized protein LOC125647095 [Ostrea edulis]|uniref:uncharacterized protein LOC125661695 n=1 Tax=Ostrea edulis TaxID=37623 RepID=UPI0020941962|nr:uncharacterized protein LOC125661695 [Ostrea edulis]XP_055999991.1 uncharacterized protein LOC125647095 [Ostrea edulis]